MLTGLKQRGARWYLRRRVPADLVESWGAREVNRALGTSDYRVARAVLPRAWADVDEEFAAKRASASPHLRSQASDLLLRLRPANTLQIVAVAQPGRAAPPLAVPNEDGPRVSELHAEWLKQEERPPSTMKEMQRAVDRFINVIEDKRVKALSRRDVTAFSDKMREPGGVTPEGVSIPTTNTTLSLLSALFGMAVKRNYIEHNPAKGTQLKDTRRAREKRREFDAPALGAIFGSAIYAADDRPDGGAGEAAYWLPLLALYTGARINELCQLHPCDMAQEGYTDAKGKPQKAWVIRIEHDRAKGQRVKTEGSERRIPVHPDLVKLGFVKYAQAQTGRPLLFDKLSMGPKETRLAGNWGRWFARYLRKTCGVTDERMTFHSFRHAFKHHMRQCQVPKDVNDALTGHETGDAADAYGGLSFPLFPLVEGMKRYRVDGFKLPAPPPAYRPRQAA